MRKFLFLLLLIISNLLNAQKPDPINEQWTYFPYAVGKRTDGKLKVMIIGTHLIRFKSLVNASNVNVDMSLDFTRIVDEIQRNERYFSADYENIGFSSTVIEDLYGDYLKWNAATARNNDLSTSDNTLSAMEKIRTKLIDSYKAQGYKVYQVDFKLDVASYYKYYEAATSTYKTISFERLAPLSPLYVAVYRKSEIKDMLSRLNQNAGNYSGPALTIESKDDNKKNDQSKNKANNSNSGGLTEEQIQRNISYHKVIARSIEAEGDKLYAAGESNYREALAKYEAAQRESYSSDVQLKIDHIKNATWVGMADAGVQLAKSLDGIAEAADPHEKTKIGFSMFNYSGLSGSYTKLMNPSLQKPMDAYFSVVTHRIFLSWEIRVGYMESPLYEYTITKGSSPTPYKVQLKTSCITAGSSIGLNIPLKPLVLYGMYGIDLADGISTGRTLLNSDFTLKDFGMVPLWRTKTTLGATLNIPKTKLAIGVQYHMYSISGKDYTTGNTGEEIIYNKDQANHYYYGKTTNDNYKFSNIGVSIGWTL
jgi:hypothetical protein